MGNFENGLKRLALAGRGAAAKGYEDISDFFEGRECRALDELAEKGKKVIEEGKEANEELQHKFEDKFDEFYDRHRTTKKEIDIASMTDEERAELLEKLTNFKKSEA